MKPVNVSSVKDLGPLEDVLNTYVTPFLGVQVWAYGAISGFYSSHTYLQPVSAQISSHHKVRVLAVGPLLGAAKHPRNACMTRAVQEGRQ